MLIERHILFLKKIGSFLDRLRFRIRIEICTRCVLYLLAATFSARNITTQIFSTTFGQQFLSVQGDVSNLFACMLCCGPSSRFIVWHQHTQQLNKTLQVRSSTCQRSHIVCRHTPVVSKDGQKKVFMSQNTRSIISKNCHDHIPQELFCSWKLSQPSVPKPPRNVPTDPASSYERWGRFQECQFVASLCAQHVAVSN